MPKIKTSRVKYPDGWELIEPTLGELEAKMREGWSLFSLLPLMLSCVSVVKISFW